MLHPSPPKTGPKSSFGTRPTSYDWLFFHPAIKEVKPGSTVEIVDKNFTPYLDKVKKWNLEIETHWLTPRGEYSEISELAYLFEKIAVNKSGKLIAARIVAANPEQNGKGSVCLLPKPTECNTHEAVEILIDIATSEERVEPEWRTRVEIPGLDEVEKQINQLTLDYEKQMNELELKRQSLDKYRNVFSVHDSSQVDAVRIILNDIGIQTERTKPGFPVDLLGKELAVEVTSIAGKINSDSPKMFQLIQFFEKHHNAEKVLLVANTYKREHPSARTGKQDFTPPVVDFLKLKQVCALTSVTLLNVWRLGKTDPAKARKLLLETSDELRL